jgi:hypothetical protein
MNLANHENSALIFSNRRKSLLPATIQIVSQNDIPPISLDSILNLSRNRFRHLRSVISPKSSTTNFDRISFNLLFKGLHHDFDTCNG